MTSNGRSAPIVLVVEDEPMLRLAAIDMVEEIGFTAMGVADADEAVRILETRTDIRIVMTDIDMPGSLDGMKLAACIRDRWPPIQIIIVSGHLVPLKSDMPPRAVFIPKPYRSSDIQRVLLDLAA